MPASRSEVVDQPCEAERRSPQSGFRVLERATQTATATDQFGPDSRAHNEYEYSVDGSTFANLLGMLMHPPPCQPIGGGDVGTPECIGIRPEPSRWGGCQGNGPDPPRVMRVCSSPFWLRERVGGSEAGDCRPRAFRT